MEIEYTCLDYYNPIEKACSLLKIVKMPLNRMRLANLQPYKNDNDLRKILTGILKDLDLSKRIEGIMPFNTNSPKYQSLLSEYIYYLEHLENHLEYNIWIDKLLAFHSSNLIEEKNYIPPKQPKKKTISGKSAKNAFYRRQTVDLFSNDVVYEYINPKTGTIIKSDNPNLCDKLNAEIEQNIKYNRARSHARKNQEKRESIRINTKPDFNKLKFKF